MHIIVRNLKWISKMSTFPPLEKFLRTPATHVSNLVPISMENSQQFQILPVKRDHKAKCALVGHCIISVPNSWKLLHVLNLNVLGFGFDTVEGPSLPPTKYTFSPKMFFHHETLHQSYLKGNTPCVQAVIRPCYVACFGCCVHVAFTRLFH